MAVLIQPSAQQGSLLDDGQVANVGGYASRLPTACVELASTVVDPEVIACDLAGCRTDGHGHDFHGDSTDADSTVNSDVSSIAAFVKAAIKDFGDAADNVAAVASTCARRRLFRTAEEENLKFNAVHVQPDVCGLWTSFLLQCWRLFGVVASGTPVVVSSGTFCNRHHRPAWGSLFERLLHGRCATSPQR